LFFILSFKESQKSSRSSEAEILGGFFGLFLNRKKQNRQIIEQIIASINIRRTISDLLLEDVTIIAGNTKPIATPRGFDIVPTVVAIVR
jgi:hypothetical protein